MPINKNGGIDFCIDCIGKMAIQCAWCEGAILIGDPVTLYTPSKKNFEIPKGAVVFNENPLQLVGCGRASCADTGADYAGSWMPGDDNRGYVRRRPTAYEQILGNEVATMR